MVIMVIVIMEINSSECRVGTNIIHYGRDGKWITEFA